LVDSYDTVTAVFILVVGGGELEGYFMSALGMRLSSDPRTLKLLCFIIILFVFRGVPCCKWVCDFYDWSGNKRGSFVVGRPLFKRTVHNG
jgi:hypothetical protein